MSSVALKTHRQLVVCDHQGNTGLEIVSSAMAARDVTAPSLVHGKLGTKHRIPNWGRLYTTHSKRHSKSR